MKKTETSHSNHIPCHCLGCNKPVVIEGLLPERWQWNQRQIPHVSCPQCGCACVPDEWRTIAAQECDRNPQLDLTALEYRFWVRCPGARQCQTHGCYAGDCEQAGVAVRPKCLVPLHWEIQSISTRLARLENTALSHQVRSVLE